MLEVLGDPARTITRLGGGGGDDPITIYTYPRRGMKVSFHPNRANTKNIAIGIAVYRHRKQLTAEGIGLGSRRSQVRREIAGARCRRFDPTYAVCYYVGKGTQGSITTTFWLNRRDKFKLVTLSRIIGD